MLQETRYTTDWMAEVVRRTACKDEYAVLYANASTRKMSADLIVEVMTEAEACNSHRQSRCGRKS